MLPYNLCCLCCNNQKSVWYANGVRMHKFLEFSFCLITLCIIAMLVIHTSSEKTAKTCVDLQPASGSGDNVIQENKEGDVHISFVLSNICAGSLGRAVIKLITHETGHPVDLCTVIFQNNTCIATDKSRGCYCLNIGHDYYSVSWKFKLADKSLMLRLTDLSTQEEKEIFLNKTEHNLPTKGLPIKKLGPPEITGICSGVIVAVVLASVLIRKWSSRGSCTGHIQGPAKDDSEMTSSNVVVRQTQKNTGSSSELQAQENIQARAGSLQPSGSHAVIDNKAVSLIHTTPKRKIQVYNHIQLSRDKMTRGQDEAYSHIKPSTDTTPRSQTEVYSNNLTSNDMVMSSEAPVYNLATPSIHTTFKRPKPPDDTTNISYAQVRRHTMTPTEQEKRRLEQVYNHALPYPNSDSNGLAQVKFSSVPSKPSSPINPSQVWNTTLPSTCRGARSLTQVSNHILPYSYSSYRSQEQECNQTIQCTYSAVRRQDTTDGQSVSLSQTDPGSQDPVQREFYDQVVFSPNRRRQVVHSMYDHISC